MKLCNYEGLTIGKMYDTVRKRSYERGLYSQPERLPKYLIGECYPTDTFVIVELMRINDLKWSKILTSQGVVGWTLWIEALEKNPAFVELTPEAIEISNVTKENP